LASRFLEKISLFGHDLNIFLLLLDGNMQKCISF